jgi:hypothetical protein
MSKPTVLEHRTEIRALLQEMAAAQFTDAEIDQALANALNVLSSYVPRSEKITLSNLNPAQCALDLTAEAPAESVLEVTPSGGTARYEFRARGNELILMSPLGATSAEILFRSRFKHDGTNVEWYPPHLRGGVCLYAAALLILGHARELVETDYNKTIALTTLAGKLYDTALATFGARAAQNS